MCYIASHCDAMSLSFLCAFVTLNKRLLTYLLTYLLIATQSAAKENVGLFILIMLLQLYHVTVK